MYYILLIISFCFPFQVTADGSINCANQPDEQESLVGQLIFCEAAAAVNLLCQGGNFVFKMFTAFEHLMISLLYLLACLFQEVQVIKPGRYHNDPSTGLTDKRPMNILWIIFEYCPAFWIHVSNTGLSDQETSPWKAQVSLTV